MRTRNDGAPVATVIIAAYGRPDVLNVALRSLLRQSLPRWRALVMCDACPPEFHDGVTVRDTRIRHLNVPIRCGNQYGPNTLGLDLVDTPYVAFLNHDDVWLDDHLENAVAVLEAGADAFLGSAAFLRPWGAAALRPIPRRPVFTGLNQPERVIEGRCVTAGELEPVSSWVVRTDTARRVGPFYSPDEAAGDPLRGWLCRLVTTTRAIHAGPDVSVVKANLHSPVGRFEALPDVIRVTYRALRRFVPSRLRMLARDRLVERHSEAPRLRYVTSSAELEGLRWLSSMDADTVRTVIDDDLRARWRRGGPWRAWGAKFVGSSARARHAGRFNAAGGTPLCGADAVDPWRSSSLRALVARRTGEDLDRFPSIHEIREAVRSRGLRER